MINVMLNGFLTGLILQMAIGPIFIYILNISLQKTIIDGWFAVLAVTTVDYLFITLAVLGVGSFLEKPKIKLILGIISSIVLILFGVVMIISAKQFNPAYISTIIIESNYFSSFASAFLLTISSPLTIIFWTSLFATKAIDKGYTKQELIFFGLAAGLATFVFLGFSITLFSLIKASIPIMLLKILNFAVGSVLIIYGLFQLSKIINATRNNSQTNCTKNGT
jgi:threonine/homoserine/homoserine lactone efflux protein